MPNEFEVVGAPVPAKPNYVQLTLDVSESGTPAVRSYSGSFFFRIQESNGREIEVRQGNLDPHLSGPLKQKLKDVLDAAMDKAKATVP